MNLYIEIEDNNPINHPISEDNLILAFGEIPTACVPFTRIDKPSIGRYEIYEGCNYVYIDGVCSDFHVTRQMTQYEKDEYHNELIKLNPYPSWILDESIGLLEPPVPYPQDGKCYQWDEETISWIEPISIEP